MDIRKIKKLIDLIQESDVTEIEIQEGEESVRISRNGPTSAPMMMTAPAMQAVPAAAPAPIAIETETPVAAANTNNAVKSPMVGTFYRSSVRCRPISRRRSPSTAGPIRRGFANWFAASSTGS